MVIAYTRSSTIYDESRATKEIFAFLEAGYSVVVLGWDRNGVAYDKCVSLFEKYADRVEFSFYSGDIGESKVQKILCRYNWNPSKLVYGRDRC